MAIKSIYIKIFFVHILEYCILYFGCALFTGFTNRLLIQLVEQYGVRKWAHIAQALPGRIGKQCRERWHNHLRPDIKVPILFVTLYMNNATQ